MAVAGAVDQERGQQQCDLVQGHGGDHTDAAQGADRVAGAEAGAASAPLAQSADDERAEHRSAGEQGGGDTGESGGAEHLLGQQGADDDTGGESDAADQLRCDQDGQDPPLFGGLGGLGGVGCFRWLWVPGRCGVGRSRRAAGHAAARRGGAHEDARGLSAEISSSDMSSCSWR